VQKIKTLFMSIIMTIALGVSYITVPTVIAGSMLAFSGTADAAECTLYETLHPNFPLTGAHLSTGKCSTCASCHAGGIYLGTPKICATCHNGSPIGQISAQTIGRSANHIPIGTASCDSCHNTTSFTASWSMNHASVSSLACNTCHNGSYTAYGATGQDANHAPETADCGACHTTLDTPTHTNADWTMSHATIHAGVTTGCVSCHNGTYFETASPPAFGKKDYAPGHPVTSDNCETCHSINNTFKCASLIEDKMLKKMMSTQFAWIMPKNKTAKSTTFAMLNIKLNLKS